MRKSVLGVFVMLLFALTSTAGEVVNPKAISDMLDRIGGKGASELFVTVVDENLSTDGCDLFVITSRDGKPCIKGNNTLAVTTGINWYLNHYAHVNLTWNCMTANLSAVQLPVPANDEVHRCSADYRYYLNYCTFSYSMAFWTWERWQQEVDWMAMHGINMPLVLVGLETVWRDVLTEIGYSKSEINEFVAGPGFMAWFAMNNLEGWGGTGAGMKGNPDWWYERQGNLCRQILAAMREYGMKPVLPGYSGMVPNSMRAKKPTWNIIESGTWAGGYTRPDILSPADTKNFGYMSELYYRHLKKLMGTSEFYSMDPFHEGGVPTGQVSIKSVYNGVMKAMDDYAMTADELKALGIEKPKWVVQYWQNLPNATAFASVPLENPDRFVALDLFSDGNPNWSGNHYAGHDFIYCMLHNFGGRTGLHGRVAKTISGYYAALKKGNMRGIGATPEGIETNPMLYDMLFELPWRAEEPAPEEWLRTYAYNRYGIDSKDAHAAWVKLLNSVHNCTVDGQQGTTEPVILARPAWTVNSVSSWSKSAIYWDVQDVLNAADLLLSLQNVPQTSMANYSYDVVDVVRQSMVDFAYYLLPEIKKAYNKRDTAEYERLYKLFLQLMLDVDTLLSADTNFTLGRWTTMARDVTDEAEGTTVADKNWMEWNARTQITVWSKTDSNLHDYSNRCWSGLIKDYHYQRWKMFFENNGAAPSGGWFTAFERPWTLNFTDYVYDNTVSGADAVATAKATFNNYFGVLGGSYYFPYGVTRDASAVVTDEAYRGEEYRLPIRELKEGVKLESLWIDLNGDQGVSSDEQLTVVDNATESQMRLRGSSTINDNDKQPLIVVNDYIIDIPVGKSIDYSSLDHIQLADILSITPDDIESIEVLRDAASCAIWGSRGANGVIKIKTKGAYRVTTRVNASVKLPADATIGTVKAVATLSDKTILTFKVAIREKITEPRTVTVATDGNGTVSIEGSEPLSVTNTNPVTMSAKANAGYDFYRWVDARGNAVSNENPYTYYGKETATFTAQFVVNKWGVPGEDLSDMGDIKSFAQYAELISIKRYNKEEVKIYEAQECPSKLFNVVPGIVNVARGSSFDIKWNDPASNGLKYCCLSAYIDLNADGDFDDEGELVKVLGTKGAQSTAVSEGTINVLLPYEIPLGITHMRIRFDGAWKEGFDNKTKAFPAKADANRMIYEIVLNVGEYPETASLVTIKSNNEQWGQASMELDGQIGENTGSGISVASGMLMRLIARPIGTAQFVCWKDRYGRVVSTQPEFKMYAVEDGEFTAVFHKGLVIDNWEFGYETENKEITLTSIITKGSGNLVIPSKVTIGDSEYTIVGFANGLFNGVKSLTSITLPATLRFVNNNIVAKTSITGNGEVQVYKLKSSLPPKKSWTLSLKMFTDGSTYNQWGSGLLATGEEPLGESYKGGFQIYLAKAGNIVMKIGGSTEYALDNSNCTIAPGTAFDINVESDGAGTLSIEVINANGVVGCKEVSLSLSNIFSFSTAMPKGIDINLFELRSGDAPKPFVGCSNLFEILVENGSKHFLSKDGVLYDINGRDIICYPEGKTTAIESVDADSLKTRTVFDLGGNRVESVSGSGIYIVDGKKVFIKK